MTPLVSGVYYIQNILDDKIYIGSSVNINRRIVAHFAALRRNGHQSYRLQSAFNKDGESNFVSGIIEAVTSDNLTKAEQGWIDFFKPEYNKHSVAFRVEFSKEHRDNMSKAQIGNRHTDEAKAKIGDASKGNKYRLGVRHTEERKRKMSEFFKGFVRPRGKENPLYGRKRDPEVIKKCIETRFKNKVNHPNCYCGKPFHAKGLCKMHYKKEYRKNKSNES